MIDHLAHTARNATYTSGEIEESKMVYGYR